MFHVAVAEPLESSEWTPVFCPDRRRYGAPSEFGVLCNRFAFLPDEWETRPELGRLITTLAERCDAQPVLVHAWRVPTSPWDWPTPAQHRLRRHRRIRAGWAYREHEGIAIAYGDASLATGEDVELLWRSELFLLMLAEPVSLLDPDLVREISAGWTMSCGLRILRRLLAIGSGFGYCMPGEGGVYRPAFVLFGLWTSDDLAIRTDPQMRPAADDQVWWDRHV